MLLATLQSTYFNSRPCVRGDARAGARLYLILKFQFTPLREGRRNQKWKNGQFTKFQFTPLREGRHIAFDNVVFHVVFQFTPLREGRRKKFSGKSEKPLISIHAPA